MKNALIIGSKSDIAQGLIPLLQKDEWNTYVWYRGMGLDEWDFMEGKWDLFICALGSVAPVGLWHDIGYQAWENCVDSNLLLPLRMLRYYWPDHNPGASVCFLAGPNPNTIMDGYSAYNVSKMALLKLVEQLDHETPDTKFFALGPGTILTKIHKPTLEASWINPKLKRAIEDNYPTNRKIHLVYDCLQWCIEQPKEIIGGRNICTSDDWENLLNRRLEDNPDLFKLRRCE